MKMKISWKVLSILVLFGLIFAASAAPAYAGQKTPITCDPDSFFLYVKHAINGEDLGLPRALPVDVYVNGDLAIPNFQYGDQVRTSLPAGSYAISVTLAGTQTEVMSLGPVELPGCAKVAVYAKLVRGVPTLKARVISLEVPTTSR
jgi:hypothetical protein